MERESPRRSTGNFWNGNWSRSYRIAEQIADARQCRGLFFVKPDDDPEWVRDNVKRLGLHGLKCYFTMADVSSIWEADTEAYLPEPIVKVADEEGWVITLHLVKSRAVADPANIACIRQYCEKHYAWASNSLPRVLWVVELIHCQSDKQYGIWSRRAIRSYTSNHLVITIPQQDIGALAALGEFAK